MIKKAILGTAAAAVLGALIFGRDFCSYARTWGNSVREAVKSEVPLEFEIERARQEVESLVADIHNVMDVIIEQEVEVQHKAEAVAQKQQAMETQRAAILALRGDLGNGKSTFRYASHTYTRDEVERDLKNRFERYKAAEVSLKSDRQILQALEQTLDANREKFDNMLTAKRQLEVQIEKLQARLRTVQAAEAATEIAVDDSRLARAKKLIRDLDKQLDIRQKRLDMQGKSLGLIPIDQKDDGPSNVTAEIDEYFDHDGQDVQTSVAEIEIE